MSKKDKKSAQEEPHHSGSVAPEDEDLTKWLNRLWARNEPPERMEVWQITGPRKDVRGEMIFHEDFPPGKKLDVEQANKLANEIMAAAQHDCDSTPKKHEAYFQIAIIDRNRRASPLVRRIGPLQPKRSYKIARQGDVTDDIDDEDQLDAKRLELAHIKAGFEEVRWDKKRNDHVLGDVIVLVTELLREERGRTQQLMSSHMDFFQRLQDAEDRKVQREIMLQREQFKFEIAKDGWRTVRNILPGLFADKGGAQTQQQVPANGQQAAAPRDFGPSPERTLVDNFLNDCEEKSLAIPLFGDYKEGADGKLALVKPGVFSTQQFSVMWGVREGRLPVDALDNLMPSSGHEFAITEEQIKQAAAAGVTEGIGIALLELIGLRNKAAEAKAAAAQQSNPPTTTVEATT